jgi:hypothetical protein
LKAWNASASLPDAMTITSRWRCLQQQDVAVGIAHHGGFGAVAERNDPRLNEVKAATKSDIV